MGSEVVTHINEESPYGSYEVELNATGLPAEIISTVYKPCLPAGRQDLLLKQRKGVN